VREFVDFANGRQLRVVASSVGRSVGDRAARKYDAFISHASEDKAALVRPLAERLRTYAARIWYDEFELRPGDSLVAKIDRGLAESNYGILVISPAFLTKPWPEYERQGLTARDVIAEGQILVPVWHNVDVDEVSTFSPTLAQRFALKTVDMHLDELALRLLEVIRPDLAEGPRRRALFDEMVAKAEPELVCRLTYTLASSRYTALCLRTCCAGRPFDRIPVLRSDFLCNERRYFASLGPPKSVVSLLAMADTVAIISVVGSSLVGLGGIASTYFGARAARHWQSREEHVAELRKVLDKAAVDLTATMQPIALANTALKAYALAKSTPGPGGPRAQARAEAKGHLMTAMAAQRDLWRTSNRLRLRTGPESPVVAALDDARREIGLLAALVRTRVEDPRGTSGYEDAWANDRQQRVTDVGNALVVERPPDLLDEVRDLELPQHRDSVGVGAGRGRAGRTVWSRDVTGVDRVLGVHFAASPRLLRSGLEVVDWREHRAVRSSSRRGRPPALAALDRGVLAA
jgi:hypothetical protein